MIGDKYSVYKHVSPTDKVYIGITSLDPKKRWCNGNGYAKNENFQKDIKEYGWDNFKHEILYTNITIEEAQQIERDLIAFYHSNEEEHGYNLTSGGEKCKRHTQKTKEKMSMVKIGKYVGELNPRWGTHLSEDTRRKISAALKGKMTGSNNPNFGKSMSDEQKSKISNARRGKHYPKLSEAIKNSKACKDEHDKQMKPVEQYTKDGEYIQTWKSAPEASIYLIGSKHGQSNICSCANGHLQTAYDYIWRYANEDKNNKEVTA